MISVPAGSVTLSDRRTRRRWTVEVGPYLLAEVPVAQGLYARVTGGAPGDAAEEPLPAREVSWHDAVRFRDALSVREGLTPAYAPGGDADGIAWDAAADGYRLPPEAEGEHACRAGTDGARYGPLDGIARYRATSGGYPRPVRGRRPNAWASTTWWAGSGKGAGTSATGRSTARTACCAAAAGSTSPGAAAPRRGAPPQPPGVGDRRRGTPPGPHPRAPSRQLAVASGQEAGG